MKLEDLQVQLTNMSEDQLLDLIGKIRNDRKVSKRPEKPLTQRAKKEEKNTKLAALFKKLPPEEQAKLIAMLKG